MERILRIESLVQGGEGLARDEGRVVFVPLVASGDLVRAEVEPSGSVLRGRLLEVLEPGPARVTPPCRHAGTCGGCGLQHVAAPAQLEAKQRMVVEALTRVGRLEAEVAPIVASPRPVRYRRRARAHLTKDGWGFTKRASHDLVDIDACLLIEEGVESFLGRIAQELRAVGLASAKTFAVDATEDGARASLHLDLAKAPTPRDVTNAEKLIDRIKGLRGVVLSSEGARTLLVGQPVLVDVEHHRLRVRPDLFAQANRLGARLLAKAAAETIVPGSSVLELFAGAGTLSLPMALRAGALVSTEGEGPSLELLRQSLTENGTSAQLVAGPAKRVVDGLAAEHRSFDHVVLDPPRTGAREVIESLLKIAAPRITYVSCDAPTFARDAGLLVRAGYVLEQVTPFDLFPHTHHIELVATLSRR